MKHCVFCFSNTVVGKVLLLVFTRPHLLLLFKVLLNVCSKNKENLRNTWRHWYNSVYLCILIRDFALCVYILLCVSNSNGNLLRGSVTDTKWRIIYYKT